jgi:GNAT superfamily N-acetyltransferase
MASVGPLRPATGETQGALGNGDDQGPQGNVESLPIWPRGAAFVISPYRVAWRGSHAAARVYDEHFRQHHYLDTRLPPAAQAAVVYFAGSEFKPVAFGSALHAMEVLTWRESRLVVLPEHRGLGLGRALSEWFGEYHLTRGERFRSTTQNEQVGAARDASPLWQASSWNRRVRSPKHAHATGHRTGVKLYSHEYVGADACNVGECSG